MTSHIFSVLVEDSPGVLSRVTGLFSRRGFNIESLAVGPCEQPATSRITIVVTGNDVQIEQVKKQLNKLIEVIKVLDVSDAEHVERELAMIKVRAEPGTARSEIMQIAGIFRAKIIDVGSETLVIEVTGDSGKIAAIEDLVRPYGILELVRTGKIALQRGSATVSSGR
ncbi:MAG TPA: acetolactate synthase small subunit [Methanospirillum sp.]|uniref:acetolactate synthase small subunit n=1 Tax=Methanospirillum sp. TaxID=45200 RepID=UPI002BE1D7A8|nr:acetolactate synthase small subunit [Methanospirillum sp.]HOJ95502.1 acetolactate synthase small subunit [Methanospirillum sp.]HOL40503.1 acetolactate synthase small subunit [Methanospirillum sp.]HPP77231.1 acetolactate synthase small subunit [Methanospirillum sp.]